MRSRCSRSIITISAPARPSRMSRVTSTPKRSMPDGQQRGGRDQAHARAERVEQDDVGARDPRMQDVAADRDDQPFDAALVAADGERVEQRLRRMLMRAVAGIDDRAVDFLRQKLDRAGRVMPHHQDIRMHGVERHRGVDQRLALFHGGGIDRHVHHVGAEPLAGELERRLRAGGGFEEEIDLGPAAQRGALLLDLPVEGDEFLGEVEEADNLVIRKPFDSQQVAPVENERRFRRNVH